MWVGFIFAAYSAVANDSIQTLGTFLASNRNKPWWLMWFYIGGVFFLTVLYSWLKYNGDVTHDRLSAKGFEIAPSDFAFLQIAAPIFLILITRLKMPVSTTFLLLSSFSTKSKGIIAVLTKSLSGYFIAFLISIFIWGTLGKWMQNKFTGKAHPLWKVFQWFITGLLWSVWIMQDAANIAVYLPRKLSAFEFLVFCIVIIIGLGVLFKMGGEKIQEIVDEKSNVVDVRAATIIDFIYVIILYIFKIVSNVPMSTTWVFLGLLGGREIALSIQRINDNNWTLKRTLLKVGKDVSFALIGLVISLVIAVSVNPIVRSEILGF